MALPDNFDVGELDEPSPPSAGLLWVGGIATAVVAALVVVAGVFIARAALSSKVFTAVINLVAGVAVISLLSGVARSAVRRGRMAGPVVSPGLQRR